MRALAVLLASGLVACAPTENVDTSSADAMANSAGTVTVTVNGARANGGPVLVALQSPAEFARAAGRFAQTAQASASSVTVTFTGVPAGTYAAAAVQDTDGNGTFTIGQTGPTEPWGLSGAPQSGPPAFGPASFTTDAAGGTAAVTLSGG